jgi:hypothetical protein
LMRRVVERQHRSQHPIITQPLRRRSEPTHALEPAAGPVASEESSPPPR